MKKLSTLVTTAAIFSFTMLPAFAQKQTHKQMIKDSPTQKPISLPQGKALSDKELSDVEGGVPVWPVSIGVGAASGAISQAGMNAATGKPLGEGVRGSAVAGGISGAANPVSTTTQMVRWGRIGYKYVEKVNWGSVIRNVGVSGGGGLAGGAAERGLRNNK